MAREEMRELGPEQLKALTHPLRVEIIRALRSDGPATATALARRLGESSGSTSYHLRQLERHGFVEEVPDSGDGRDRWWRAAFRGQSVDPAKWHDDPGDRSVVAAYEAMVVRGAAQTLGAFIEEQANGEWDNAWVDAATVSDKSLRLTPAQLRRLVDKMHALLDSFERYDSPGAERVVVQVNAFPRRPRPFGDEQ